MSPRGILSAALLASLPFVDAAYQSVDKFSGSNFFDNWQFFTGSDPTHGFVQYVDRNTAQANGLISTANGVAYFGVDYTSTLNPNSVGRQSIRLSSNRQYTEGLFIADINHMPGGICGTWPSWWTLGGNWPNNGEIGEFTAVEKLSSSNVSNGYDQDIIEGINAGTTNLMSLHTSDQCTTSGNGETGTLLTGDCYQYDPNQSNSGCGVSNPNTQSYGSGFNGVGGGVYAMEWTGDHIAGWFFPRNAIPGDIQSGNPNPSGWGTPFANFQGSCNIPAHFNSHNIIFDTTFCGDWAGPAFSSDPKCNSLASSCQNYVAGNPGSFKNAYWSVNYVQVYQQNGQNAASRVGAQNAEVQPDILAAMGNTSSVTPVASTDPGVTASYMNNAPGNTGAPPPGVTPAPEGPTMHINQVPATANSTSAEVNGPQNTGLFKRRDRSANLLVSGEEWI